MEEVLDLADRITVLRDGRHVGDLDRAEATHEKIVALMVGRELSANYFPPTAGARPVAEPVLAVEDLAGPGRSRSGVLQRLPRRDPGLRRPRRARDAPS